jgi:hypothetical protein
MNTTKGSPHGTNRKTAAIVGVLFIQDFRLSRLKRRNVWMVQLSPQVITQEIGFDLI